MNFHRMFHFSKAQVEILNEFTQFNKRPSFEEYLKYHNRLKSVAPEGKLKIKDIPKVTRGFRKDEVKLGRTFQAQLDLPEGWAVCPCNDSGDNHEICHAGDFALRYLWNGWKQIEILKLIQAEMFDDSPEKARRDAVITSFEYSDVIFRKFFTTPYKGPSGHIGARFGVIKKLTDDHQSDYGTNDLWLIKFEGGICYEAFEHEIVILDYEKSKPSVL